MTRFLLCISLIALSFSSYGQSLAPREQVERFSQSMANPDFDKSIAQLLRQNEEVQFNNFNTVLWKEEFKKSVAPKLFEMGKHLGMEIIKEDNYSPSLKRMVYLQKLEHGVLFWQFYFYKPSDRWVIMQIAVDSDINKFIK